VTSTSTKVFATLTGALANDAPTAGPVAAVTPPSLHALRTGEKVNVPALVTLLTYTFRYATGTVDAGMEERSNSTSPVLPEAMEIDTADP
jgi:hypothetical protein